MRWNLGFAVLVAAVLLVLLADVFLVSADNVPPGNPSGIALSTGEMCWGADGLAWEAVYPPGFWARQPEYDLPVSVADVAHISTGPRSRPLLITFAGDVWIYNGDWAQMPPFPTGPVSIDAMSWGDVKGMHR